jgi:hypothetical protein
MTVQEVLTRAYSHSTKNAPGRIITDSTEGFDIVIETVRKMFQLAARLNREYFGESAVVVPVTGGWPRPATAESVYRLEIGSGERDAAEVVRVPFDDRDNEFRKPSVYTFGAKYWPASARPIDPIATGDTPESLRIFYAGQPVIPADLGGNVDPRLSDDWRELLALEVAIYMSLKDKRLDEVPALKGERDRWLLSFVMFLEHEDVGEHRRFDHDRRFNAPSMVPLQQLVAGGTDLKLGG